jgi:hypothetical protein
VFDKRLSNFYLANQCILSFSEFVINPAVVRLHNLYGAKNMNMISTGAFQTEMDASNRQDNLVAKLVAAWEKKNTKVARAGGVSLMALSLAACGSDDEVAVDAAVPAVVADPVPAVVVVEPVVVTPATFDLTPLVDIASGTQALNGSLANTFRFSDANEIVNGITATMAAGDTLLDTSSTDADVLNVTLTGNAAITTVNIETINLSYAVAAADFAATNTGTTAYNVSGAVAGVLSTPTAGAEITLTDFGRVLTIEGLTLTGTAALGSAESLSITLDGATYGATAASQTGIEIDGTDANALETLTLTSSGDTANTVALTFENTETVGTYTIAGDQDITVRAPVAKVTGAAVNGTTNTGNVALSLDTNGNITVNASNFTAVDDIVLRDSVAGANNATLNSLASGQDVVVTSAVGTLTPTITGATFSAFGAASDLDLNGSSATAGVTVTTLNGQNTTALNLVSQGLASSTSTTAANTISNLDGDYSTITITGDTSLAITDLDIEAVQTATTATTARAVTVDASAMTGNAFLSTSASADSKVSYTITGTLGADTLVANNSGSTLNGGAGNDVLTGGNGTDAITGGAGTDHIDVSYGTADTATGGAGNDTYDINAIEVAAVARVVTINAEGVTGATIVSSGTDSITLTVNGINYTTVSAGGTAHDTNLLHKFTAAHKDAILAQHGVTLVDTNASAADGFKLTGKADGTSFTADMSHGDGGTIDAITEVVATAGSALGDVSTTISDFAAGDILDIDGITKNGSAKVDGAGGYYEGDLTAGFTDGTDYDVLVLTGASYVDFGGAEAAVAGAHSAETDDCVIVYLNSTTGTAEMLFDVDLGADNDVDAADLIATFSNITNLTDLGAAFSSDTFVI